MVLATGAADPILSRMYVAHWAIIPNLGTDLVLPPLLRMLPVHVAGRVVAAGCMLLPVLGTIAYSRAVFGMVSAWSLGAGLVAYNALLLFGFLNFCAATGLALLLAAGWIAWRERRPVRTLALATLGTVALFFCHLSGLVLFYVLIAGHEFERIQLRRTAWSAALLLPSFIAVFGFFLVSPLAPVADGAQFVSLASKARQLVFPFANYVLPLDIATACIVIAFLLVCVVTHRCRVLPGGAMALLLMTLLFVISPWTFKGTYFLDSRFVIMLGFLLFGAMQPVGLPRLAAWSAAAALVLLFIVRMGVVMFAWQQHSHDLAQLRAVIAGVQPGERVLIATVAPEEAPHYWRNVPLSRRLSLGFRLDHHLPALLLIEHRAFWPFLFDNPSQQPVMTLPPYRQLVERIGSMPRHGDLSTVDLCGYDKLLLLDAGGEPDLAHFAADRLELLDSSDIAALFKVRPASCGS